MGRECKILMVVFYHIEGDSAESRVQHCS